MKNRFSKKQPGLAVACALVLGFASGAARAQNFGPASERESWSNSSQQVWKNGFGDCWHDAYGPPPGYNECNPKPAAVQAAPAPAPYVAPVVVAAAPPQRVIQKFTFDADVLFDFDKAVLRPEGKTALDGFAGQISGISLEKMTVVGNTDRFGSDKYNQVLSEKRAAAVKVYLIAKGVQSGSMLAEGMGKTKPGTDCPGPKTSKVVACLQPDRKVEVELTGTRVAQQP
jgi:OOP family OmpA-OmpF porin